MNAITRDRSIDVAKGLAIMLIVLGHVLRGLSAAGMTASYPEAFRRVDTMIYLVHLPTFALLSGLFVQRSVERHGAKSYLRRRAVEFTWLFVVWTILQGLVKVATSSLVNAPLTLGELVREFVKPTSQMWYLPFLLLLTVVVVAGAPWRPGRRALCTALAAVITLASWGHFGSYAGLMGWALCAFFVAGVLIGPAHFLAVLAHRRLAFAATAAVLAYITLVVYASPTPPTVSELEVSPTTVAAGVAASIAGLFALLSLARGLATLRHTTWLSDLGRHSMEIFLAHIIFASGTRITLAHTGVTSLWLQIGAGLVSGIAGPLLLMNVTQKMRLNWLFCAPTKI